jgi:hypothetical protein
MAPTLNPGEFLVALARTDLRMGSLVVVEHPERPGFEMVKRLAARPGESIDGRRLGLEEYWVLGDDPNGSTDSRSFGPVRREALHGVVLFRYWPLSRAGLL